MKQLSVALIAAMWASTAFAGSYHRGSSLICSDCHTMHSSRTHVFGGPANAGTDAFTASGSFDNGGGGHEYLLIYPDALSTCLACHDENGAAGIPDVRGLNSGANQRPAGFLNVEGDGNEGTGHTMGWLSGNPPGWTAWNIHQPPDVWTNTANYGFNAEFGCDDCHAVHGNPAYRNLANIGGRVHWNYGWSGSVAAGFTWGMAPTYRYDAALPASGQLVPIVNDVDVVIVPSGKNVGNINQGDNYNIDHIAYTVAINDVSTAKYQAGYNPRDGTPMFFVSGSFAQNQNEGTAPTGGTGTNKMNSFCACCHGNFHSNANVSLTPSTGRFKKHPTTGITMTAESLIKDLGSTDGTYANLVLKPVFSNVTPGAQSFEPGCLTCHRAHGSKNSFGLVTPYDPIAASAAGTLWGNRDADLESGDGDLATGGVRLLCIQCHSHGRTGGADRIWNYP